MWKNLGQIKYGSLIQMLQKPPDRIFRMRKQKTRGGNTRRINRRKVPRVEESQSD